MKGPRTTVMSDTDQTAEMNTAAQELFARMNLALVGKKLDNYAMEKLRGIIYDYKVRAKQQFGVTMPDLGVMVFPRFTAIEVVRMDLDKKAIQNKIRQIAGKYPGITAAEIATAVKAVFPDYRGV